MIINQKIIDVLNGLLKLESLAEIKTKVSKIKTNKINDLNLNL